MNAQAIDGAARLFVAARMTGRLIGRLPQSCRAATLDDAHAIQDATVAQLGDTVAGWKVGAPIDGRVVRGVLVQSRMFASPAQVRATEVPLQGVEAEIAFRFDRDLPPSADEYSYGDVAASVTALTAQAIRCCPPWRWSTTCARAKAFARGRS